MTITTALFDLDGTLTDPELGITNCIAYALAGLDQPVPSRAELRTWIGAPLKARFAEFLSSDSMADEALRLYRHRFTDTGMFENVPYAGIRDALAAITGNVETALVVTSKPTVFAEKILEHFELRHFFRDVHDSELDGRHADKADLMAHVVSLHTLTPSSTVMIGDRRFDIRAARLHGLRSIGVLWGFGEREELAGAGADVICETVEAMPGDIASLSG